MNFIKVKSFLFLTVFVSFLFIAWAKTYSQQATTREETAEQREFMRERREEEMEMRRQAAKAMTAEEVLKILKERAALRIKERRRELMLKTRTSVSTLYKYETNPSAAADGGKSDHAFEETFSFGWVPTFTKHLSADMTYSVTPSNYIEQTDLSTFSQSAKAKLRYFPTDDFTLLVEPSYAFEWILYPLDEQSTYTQNRYAADITHYILKDVHYGGRYEYMERFYPNRLARQANQQRFNYEREDERNTYEAWLRWYRDKYSIRLKGRVYYNEGNEEYQDYNDYLSNMGSITFSGTFPPDDRLYLSWTSSYERKDYENRQARGATGTPRTDRVIAHSLSAYYKLDKTFTVILNYSWVKQKSNALSAKYRDITYSLGLMANF